MAMPLASVASFWHTVANTREFLAKISQNMSRIVSLMAGAANEGPPKEPASRKAGSDAQKHAKFRELAEKRTNKALDAIRVVGNLANRQLYHYEDAEVRKVIKALRDAVGEAEAKFTRRTGRGTGNFKL